MGGVYTNNKKDLCKLTDDVFLNPQNINISEAAFEKIKAKFETFKSTNSDRFKKKKKFPLDLFKEVDINIPEIETNVNFWLKPIGDKDNHVTIKWKFSAKIQELCFSKIEPSGVHKNDIVITYGVGCGYILSVYRVISDEPYFASEEDVAEENWKERWPWSLEAENLAVKFSKKCHKYKIKLSDIKVEFLNQFPQSYTNASGTSSFGRFNRGGDKLKLNPMFAKFVMQKIFSLN